MVVDHGMAEDVDSAGYYAGLLAGSTIHGNQRPQFMPDIQTDHFLAIL